MALIEQFKTADEAEQGLMKMLTDKAKIMGFGHRVYTTCDPRSDVIKFWSKRLADSRNGFLTKRVFCCWKRFMRAYFPVLILEMIGLYL
ncbi:MAG: hypothetical protein S4CHLAM7_09550 [Chlamydiae bacterium]|nr:hypothetical protein [Chlamydiota bacterium]